jgi:hypothetical protein
MYCSIDIQTVGLKMNGGRREDIAGVWIGYIADNGEKSVKNFEWEDLSVDCKAQLFVMEDV